MGAMGLVYKFTGALVLYSVRRKLMDRQGITQRRQGDGGLEEEDGRKEAQNDSDAMSL